MPVRTTTRLVVGLAIAGSLLVAAIACLLSCNVTKTEPSLGVSCWTPDHFTRSQDTYTNAVCQGYVQQLLKEGPNASDSSHVYPANPYYIPASAEPAPVLELPHLTSLPVSVSPTTIAHFIVAQLFFGFVFYLIATSIISASGGQDCYLREAWKFVAETRGDEDKAAAPALISERLSGMLASGRLARSYLLLHIAALLIWLVLAAASLHVAGSLHVATSQQVSQAASTDQQSVFLCDMSIQKLGNVQRYTVQCFLQLSDVTPPDNTPATQIPLLANGTLCLLLFALEFIHIIVFALVLPLTQHERVIPVLRGLGMKAPEASSSLILTNLSLALAVSDASN